MRSYPPRHARPREGLCPVKEVGIQLTELAARLAGTQPRWATPVLRAVGSAAASAARPSRSPSPQGRTLRRHSARRRARRSTGRHRSRPGSEVRRRASCFDRLGQALQAPSQRFRRTPRRTARARAPNAHGRSRVGGCLVRRTPEGCCFAAGATISQPVANAGSRCIAAPGWRRRPDGGR